MSANHKADAAWDDYVSQQQEEKIEELERELNAANQRIMRLEEALDTLICVIGLTPIKSNREAFQEAFDMARTVLKAKEGLS